MSDQWPPARNKGESPAAYKQRVAQLEAFLKKRAQPNKPNAVGKPAAPSKPAAPTPSPTQGGLGGIFDTVRKALGN